MPHLDRRFDILRDLDDCFLMWIEQIVLLDYNTMMSFLLFSVIDRLTQGSMNQAFRQVNPASIINLGPNMV